MEADPLAGAVPASSWSLSLGHFGQASVLVALASCLLSALLWLVVPRAPKLEPWAKWAFNLGCLAFFGTFGTLIALFVTDQFQFKYVFEHGSKAHVLQYKLAGAWSGQQGSILLWGTGSALFGLLASRTTGPFRRWFTFTYAVFLASVAGILAFESPFVLSQAVNGQILVPTDGQGLNPSLVNYWMVIHPPTIFSGFGSLTVLFAWSVAALARKDLVSWIPMVRPWALVSLSILGLGLAMGGFWAYETLGWGGFWAWDPVENTSFVPWVAVAAFLHGLFVQVSRQKWHLTNAFLAGIPFLLFCYGTFLTRSGFLGDTSVHSFAEMDHSALWILIGMDVVGFGAFLALWGVRASSIAKSLPASRAMDAQPLNRQTLMGFGIWLLVGIGLVTSIGMSIPVIQSLGGHKPRVVEEPLYNTVLCFFYLPLVLSMAVGPFLTWRGMRLRDIAMRFFNVAMVTVSVMGFLMLWLRSDFAGIAADRTTTIKLFLAVDVNRYWWVLFLTAFTVFGIVATAWKLVENMRRAPSGVGGMLAHLGVGLAMFGLVFSRGFEQKSTGLPDMNGVFVIPPHAPAKELGFTFQALGITKNLVDPDNRVRVAVARDGDTFEVDPGLYFNGIDPDGKPRPFKWPGIHSKGLYDVYLVLHDLTFEASGPTDIKVGEQRLDRDNQLLVTYHGLRTAGPLGQTGATFYAKATVASVTQTWDVEPSIKVGPEGIENTDAALGDDFRLRLVKINAADKSATLQILYRQPAYYAELYYKPLTLFVWLGIGIMTLGGALTAYTRRVRAKATDDSKDSALEPADTTARQEE